MFKQITAIILLLAFVAQIFASPFIMLDYFVNTAAYAKNCVNKAKPKMHCNGQCQVMKKIREEEKKEQQNAEGKAASKLQVLFSSSFFSLLIIPARSSGKRIIHKFSDSPVDRNLSIFHPPKV